MKYVDPSGCKTYNYGVLETTTGLSFTGPGGGANSSYYGSSGIGSQYLGTIYGPDGSIHYDGPNSYEEWLATQQEETIWIQLGFFYYDNNGDPITDRNGDFGHFWIYEAHVKTEIHNAQSQVGDGTVINHETQAYANLTDAERALVKRYPGQAASVHYNMGQAFEVTQQMFPNIRNAHNNAADAFRHAYFNALNARSIGSDLAYQFGVAHETWVGNPALESAMDISNNVFGINAAIRNPCMSNTGLANYIYNAVSNGQLIMIQNGRFMPTSIP